jgi:hypothetical protein
MVVFQKPEVCKFNSALELAEPMKTIAVIDGYCFAAQLLSPCEKTPCFARTVVDGYCFHTNARVCRTVVVAL